MTRPTFELVEPDAGRLTFKEVDRVLHIYATALTDGRLRPRAVEGAARGAYTDGLNIYLPDAVTEFGSRAENLRLYKIMIAHKWGQVQHGSLEVYEFLRGFEDRALATDIYLIVESARVETLLAGEFRGLAREMRQCALDALAKRPHPRRLNRKGALVENLLQSLLHHAHPGQPSAVTPEHPVVRDGFQHAATMLDNGLRHDDALELCQRLYHGLTREGGSLHDRLPPVHYRGDLRPDRVEQQKSEGERQQNKNLWHPELGKLTPPEDFKPMVIESRLPWDKTQQEEEGRKEPGSGSTVQIAISTPDYHETGREIELSDFDKEGAILLPEYDYRHDIYRDEWCALRERRIRTGTPDYVQRVLAKHHGLIQVLKRQFEALRPEARRLKRQPEGEEIDIDAAVEAYVDQRAGLSPLERIYIDRRDQKRDIAVAFLIDLSGSTGSWVPEGRVIEIEKEALILMSEALEILGDRYAIFGFSGATRKQSDFYKIKDFGENWGDPVKGRISSLDTFSYTRMGPPIRHVTNMFQRVESKVKILMLISDGRPNDFDAYGGRYGIEDTRRALIDARQQKVRTFGLTIDTEARDYMPYLFGERHWVMVDQIGQLPAKLPEMYRRLTTA